MGEEEDVGVSCRGGGGGGGDGEAAAAAAAVRLPRRRSGEMDMMGSMIPRALSTPTSVTQCVALRWSRGKFWIATGAGGGGGTPWPCPHTINTTYFVYMYLLRGLYSELYLEYNFYRTWYLLMSRIYKHIQTLGSIYYGVSPT